MLFLMQIHTFQRGIYISLHFKIITHIFLIYINHYKGLNLYTLQQLIDYLTEHFMVSLRSLPQYYILPTFLFLLFPSDSPYL